MLHKLIATGRLFPAKPAEGNGSGLPRPLSMGASRPGRIEWEAQDNDRLRPVLCTDPPAAMVLATEPVWYVDAEAGEAGIVELSLPFQQLPDYLSMPPISLAEAPLGSAMLREVDSDLPPPPEPETLNVRIIDTEPGPVLVLDTRPVNSSWRPRDERTAANVLDFALVSFDYDGFSIDPTRATTVMRAASGEMVQVKRRHDVEARHLAEPAAGAVDHGRRHLRRIPLCLIFQDRRSGHRFDRS